VTVGNFDGVHLGHAAIVARLLEVGRRLGLPTAVLTFDPHPARILRPGAAPAALSTPDRRAGLLLDLGVDAVLVQPVDRAFLALPAYGVPAWVPRQLPHDALVLRMASAGVIGFECLAPVAWFDPMACLVVIGVALAFHAGTAVLFGLNRFLLAWSAALPSLWYAVHRVG
jgi:hypothetical protein